MDLSQAQEFLSIKTTDPVVGGNYSNARFVPIEDILFNPDADADNSAVMSEDILLKSTKSWIALYGTSDKYSFTESGSESRDNDGAESQLEMSNPGSSDYMKWLINTYGGRPCVVLFDEISTKKTVVLGSVDQPAYITWAFESGSKKDDDKMYKLTFTREGFGSAATYKGLGAKVSVSLINVDGTVIDMSRGSRVLTQANTVATVIADITNPIIGAVLTVVGGSDTLSSTIEEINTKFDLVGGDWSAAAGAEIRLFIRAVDDYVELDRTAAV